MRAFQQRQKQLTDYLRDPQPENHPEGIETRRLEIYRDLFFNNFEGFLSSGFPVCRSLFDEASWLSLVRRFMRDYRSQSPYFLKIAEAFIQFLEPLQDDPALPGFLYELAHYEWVELALDTEQEVLSACRAALSGEALLAQPLVLSPLAWPLAYRYPVHLIGPDFRPEAPADTPTFIVVYRNRQERVEFLEINGMTAQLLQALTPSSGETAADCIRVFAGEMGQDPEVLLGFAGDLLQQLYDLDIVIIASPDESDL
jgi:uncharacterized protein